MSEKPRGVLSRIPLNRHEIALVFAIFGCLAITMAVDQERSYLELPADSAREILRRTVMLGIFALGSAVVIVAGGIDLSCGSMIAFGGTVCAVVLLWLAPEAVHGSKAISDGGKTLAEGGKALADGGRVLLEFWQIAAAIAATLTVGFLVGSLHAWLITVIGLPPFVATLATLVGLRSLGRAVVETVNDGSTQIQIRDERFRTLGIEVAIPAVLFLVLAVGIWLLLSRTVTGRHLYALGGNEEAARLSGIRTDRLKWLAYALGAMLSSLAGILYVADSSTAYPEQTAVGYELFAIAAAVVGGCSLKGGVGTIPGTVLGCLFLRVVIDGVAKMINQNASTYEGMIVGVVVVIAVALGQFRSGKAADKQFFRGPLGAVVLFTLSLLGGLIAMFFSRELIWFAWGAAATAVALGAFKFTESRLARR